MCCKFPLFFPPLPPSTPLLSICSKSSSICLFVSVTSTIGRQSALFSTINHSVGAITDTLFLGVQRSYTLGDCTAAADGFPGSISPPEQTYDLATGSLVQRPAEDQHTLSAATHICWRRPRSRSWLMQPTWVSERSAPSHCYSEVEGSSKHLRL